MKKSSLGVFLCWKCLEKLTVNIIWLDLPTYYPFHIKKDNCFTRQKAIITSTKYPYNIKRNSSKYSKRSYWWSWEIHSDKNHTIMTFFADYYCEETRTYLFPLSTSSVWHRPLTTSPVSKKDLPWHIQV